ncbi:MAG: sulfur carrier protein ThiS [Betaproteobacteria bacterium]
MLVNGVTTDIGDARNVADVVERLGLVGKRIAVEMNGRIVPRSAYGSTPIADVDRLEIVGAVGGG